MSIPPVLFTLAVASGDQWIQVYFKMSMTEPSHITINPKRLNTYHLSGIKQDIEA